MAQLDLSELNGGAEERGGWGDGKSKLKSKDPEAEKERAEQQQIEEGRGPSVQSGGDAINGNDEILDADKILEEGDITLEEKKEEAPEEKAM